MRADIHDGPELDSLQSEAGYIDARPHIRQLDENLLQRTAGPYIGVSATCRASFGLYNTREEVDGLAQALIKAQGFFA